MNWLLSGGIGSGKSEVRRLLQGHGLMTIDADSVGHEVISAGGAAFGDVAERWPKTVVDGQIDRKRLGTLVFGDPGQLAELESITHSHIFREIERSISTSDRPVVVELPVLVQPFADPWPRIVVDSPDEVRRTRVIDRGSDADEVESRMSAQPSRSQYLAAADLVVPNWGDMNDLESTVERLSGEIQRLASEGRAG